MDLTRRIITGTKFCVLLKKKKGPLRIFPAALLLCCVREEDRTVQFSVLQLSRCLRLSGLAVGAAASYGVHRHRGLAGVAVD
jgi:hypothetical protein